jgi:sulfite reductase alpha subunit-like flavoprotein
MSLEKYEAVEWAKESNVLLITSTYGDGEPPDMAQNFWNWLAAESAPKLANLRYSVLALGDTNYSAFCEFGKKCDSRFEQLGAQRIFERKDCDVEYEELAKEWTAGVFQALSGATSTSAIEPALEAEPAEPTYGRKNPFPSPLLKNVQLSLTGSAKDVRHFELGLAGSGLNYEVGDALGVFPSNSPALVSELLTTLGCDGEEAVKAGTSELPLRHHAALERPSRRRRQARARQRPRRATRAGAQGGVEEVALRSRSHRRAAWARAAIRSGGVCRSAQKARTSAVFDFIEHQGAPGRSASHRERRSLRCPWARAHGRGFHFPRGSCERHPSCARLRAAFAWI